MSVEQCTSFCPSLKAKLQNAGFLWIRDVSRCVQGGVEASADSGRFTQDGDLKLAAARLQQICTLLTDAEAMEVARVALLSASVPGRVTGGAVAGGAPVVQTLQDLLDDEVCRGTERVTTFCRSLDTLLGGGVQVGALTEFCGLPGVGKTQLAMQLAVNCMLPKELGGLQGGCLFIDTEGSFVPERFRQIASATVEQVEEIMAQRGREGLGAGDVVVTHEEGAVESTSGDNDPGSRTVREHAHTSPSAGSHKRSRDEAVTSAQSSVAANSFTLDCILQRTQYVRVLDVVSLMALLNALPSYLAVLPWIRMVIIDSIASPFRCFWRLGPNYSETNNGESSCTGSGRAHSYDITGLCSNLVSTKQLRWQCTRLLFRCGQLLQQHAREMNLCIVVSNQMATRVGEAREADGVTRALVPALGDSWAYALCTRFVITHQHDVTYNAEAGNQGERCHENVVFMTTKGRHGRGNHKNRLHAVQHRVARLIKSPVQPQGQCCFSISHEGVRDVFRFSV